MSRLFPCGSRSDRLLFGGGWYVFIPLHARYFTGWAWVFEHSQTLPISSTVLVDTSAIRVENKDELEHIVVQYIFDMQVNCWRDNSDIWEFRVGWWLCIMSFMYVSIAICTSCGRQYINSIYIPHQRATIGTASNDSFARVHEYFRDSWSCAWYR